MTPDEQAIARYEAIAAITAEMLDAVRLNDWVRLGELETCCPGLICELGDNADIPLTEGARERMIALIQQALNNLNAIESALGPHLAQLSKLIGSVRTERKLSGAYS
ncbi:MAG: flagellar protein FliT [Candidatus Methylumidiphilus sp.]